MDSVIARYLPDFSTGLPPVAVPADDFASPWVRAPRTSPSAAPSPKPAPRPAAPPENREALLAAAETRGRDLGREQGIAEARAEAQTVLEREREAFEQRFAEARRQWSETESVALASGFNAALRALDAELTGRIGRLLAPVLTDALRRQALSELTAALTRLLAEPGHTAIRVSGPGDLIEPLAARLGPMGAGVAFVAAETPEVSVQADQTVIETQLAAWTRLIASAVAET